MPKTGKEIDFLRAELPGSGKPRELGLTRVAQIFEIFSKFVGKLADCWPNDVPRAANITVALSA